MKRSGLIAIITIVLIGFVLFKGFISFVCSPNEPNPVVYVLSDVAADHNINPVTEKPDPLSWGLLINNLMKWVARACPD